MKKNAVLLMAALAAILAFALVGCGSGGSAGSVGIGDDGGEANYENNTITITLPSNPTTGYDWTASIDPQDGAKQTTDEYAQDSSGNGDEAAVGVGGTQTYTYLFSAEGTYTISLEYARSWEMTKQDLSYTLTITTDSSGNIVECAADDA